MVSLLSLNLSLFGRLVGEVISSRQDFKLLTCITTAPIQAPMFFLKSNYVLRFATWNKFFCSYAFYLVIQNEPHDSNQFTMLPLPNMTIDSKTLDQCFSREVLRSTNSHSPLDLDRTLNLDLFILQKSSHHSFSTVGKTYY